MKQPELGIKISELRKSKGWTQEDLVDKCNISVRTIQRIEAGEVTPRIYTVRTILEALEYDLSEIKEEEPGKFDGFVDGIKSTLLINFDVNQPSSFLTNHLTIAWIFGIVFFIIGFFEFPIDYYRYFEHKMSISNELYIAMKALVFLSYAFFIRGFILIGGIFNNYLLKIMSFIQICVIFLLVLFDVASLYYGDMVPEAFFVGISLTSGVIGILFGIALYRLRNSLGNLAQGAGILEMIIGGCFSVVILAPLGFFLLIPAEILEIILIFKTIEVIRSKQTSPEVMN